MAKAAPIIKTYQRGQVQLGERQVLRPDHHRDEEVAEHAGMDGMRNRNSITTPWAVNVLLYWSFVVTIAPCGEIRFSAHEAGRVPPMTKNRVNETRYRMPIRLWSTVNSHDQRLYPSFR